MNRTESTSAPPPVTYCIDRDDRLVSVSREWDAFATENECRALPGTSVIGTLLWDHIHDPVTAELYREVLAHVRRTGRSAAFQFRCDSPELKRFMRMTIVPLEDEEVEFRSELVNAEKRRVPFHVQAQFGAYPTLIRCSICNRVRSRGRWTDVVDAVQEGLVLNHDLPLMVAYGVCDECRGQVLSGSRAGGEPYIPLRSRG